MTESKPSRVIAYWMSEKKIQKLNWTEFRNVCSETQNYNCLKFWNVPSLMKKTGSQQASLSKILSEQKNHLPVYDYLSYTRKRT